MEIESTVEELAVRAADGEQAALADLLRVIRPDVLRRCGRFLPCREDAEEAAQDVLLHVSRKITTFERRSKFSTWLFTVITTSSLKTYRDLVRRSRDRPLASTDEVRSPRTTSVIAGTRLDLLEALDRLERTHPTLVDSFVYRQLLEMDYAEIAERTGASLGTAKRRVSVSRRLVREWIAVVDDDRR